MAARLAEKKCFGRAEAADTVTIAILVARGSGIFLSRELNQTNMSSRSPEFSPDQDIYGGENREAEPRPVKNLAEEFGRPEFQERLAEMFRLVVQSGETAPNRAEGEFGFMKAVFRNDATGRLETAYGDVQSSGDNADFSATGETASGASYGYSQLGEQLEQRGINLYEPIRALVDVHYHPGSDLMPSFEDLKMALAARANADRQGIKMRPVMGVCTAKNHARGQYQMLLMQEATDSPVGRSYAPVLDSRVVGFLEQARITYPSPEDVARAYASIDKLRTALITLHVDKTNGEYRVGPRDLAKLARFDLTVRDNKSSTQT